ENASLFSYAPHHRAPHSFPTRRSSDLGKREQAPPAHPRLRQLFPGHDLCSQIIFGSKLSVASILSTTMQVKAMSPGPGVTVAMSPSFTSDTSTASRNTSSIAHGPMTSMNL